MNVDAERERLMQIGALKSARQSLNPMGMLTVFSGLVISLKRHYSINSALVSSSETKRLLEYPITPFLEYQGGFQDISPMVTKRLVIPRHFYRIRDDYLELSEDFRLFHNLHSDRGDEFTLIRGDGNEETVAQLDQPDKSARVRLNELKEYLLAKEMHLCIQTHIHEFSALSLTDLGLREGVRQGSDDLSRWKIDFLEFDEGEDLNGLRAFTRLRVLRFVEPGKPKSEGLTKGFEDFVIGLTDDGEEIEHTSDPDSLANYFGANRGAPHFLTPVSFRKGVLEKYRQQPSKYKISENTLQCGGLWSLPIDDDHDDKVVVWLGDLGEKLPHSEQRYWRSFNFASDTGVSGTYYQRQLMAEMVESDRAEHRFSETYSELLRCGRDDLGWAPLLQLHESDQYLLQDVRVPAHDEQRDFDGLVLALAKILVDSINVKEFKRFLSDEQREELGKSIEVLEAATLNQGVDEANDHIAFLRNVQEMRSSGSAHRKGKNYRKIARKFGIEGRADLPAVFSGILEQAVNFLEFLVELTKNEDFRRNSQQ